MKLLLELDGISHAPIPERYLKHDAGAQYRRHFFELCIISNSYFDTYPNKPLVALTGPAVKNSQSGFIVVAVAGAKLMAHNPSIVMIVPLLCKVPSHLLVDAS